MQTLRNFGDQQGSSGAGTSEATRLLEDPNGIKWLFVRERRIGRVIGDGPFQFASIVWDHVIALRLLQGETIPKVTGLMLLSGEHRPFWHPEPGVEHPLFSAG